MWGLLGFLRSRDPVIVRLESPRENEGRKKKKKKVKVFDVNEMLRNLKLHGEKLNDVVLDKEEIKR
jgi:hypothetical protein